jgi:hypothetical protein
MKILQKGLVMKKAPKKSDKSMSKKEDMKQDKAMIKKEMAKKGKKK